MQRRSLLVRLVGSNLCLVAGGLFCRVYGARQMETLALGGGTGVVGGVPAPAHLLTVVSPALILLPAILFALGLRALLRGTEGVVVAEVLAQVALVLAFVVVVACLLVWQLPPEIAAVGVF